VEKIAFGVQKICEKRQDRTKVTTEDQSQYALSIGAKINNLGWPWRVTHALSFKAPAPWCC